MSTRTRVMASAARPLQHMPKYDHGTCFNCPAEVAQKHFCWGCHRYVCTGCEKFSPEGQHRPEDHIYASPVRGIP